MDAIVDSISQLIKDLLAGWVMSNLEGMFTDVNEKVDDLARCLRQQVAQDGDSKHVALADSIRQRYEHAHYPHESAELLRPRK